MAVHSLSMDFKIDDKNICIQNPRFLEMNLSRVTGLIRKRTVFFNFTKFPGFPEVSWF
jgi:hypothetical protein